MIVFPVLIPVQTKMPREGKGREIWGMYSWESRETGIPAHPCRKCSVKHYVSRRIWLARCFESEVTGGKMQDFAADNHCPVEGLGTEQEEKRKQAPG